MRSKLRALLAVTIVGAALTACSDQPTSVSVVPRVTGFNADVLPACNFTALRDAVRNYADVSGSDVIFEHIRDMSTDAYGEGMNGLARIADIRANGPKKAGAGAAEGAAAVIQFLACMPVGPIQDGFLNNIVKAFSAGGIFEVPAVGSSGPVYALGEAPGTPFWTAKPAGTAHWDNLTGQRIMVFGYKLSATGDPLEGFDYNIVPALDPGTKFDNGNALLVGLCKYAPPAVRLKHIATSSSIEILFDEEISCLTDSPPLAALYSRHGFDLASIARRTISLFTPQPLYAAAAVFGGGVGGAVSELSPTIPESVTPTITYAQQPFTNKAVGDALGILVAVSSGGIPLNGAVVTLTVTGNSGQNAILYNTITKKSCHFATRTTVDGIADFSDIGVTKSGGYTLTAEAEWDGLDAAAAVLSDLFNVKNKKIGPISIACPA